MGSTSSWPASARAVEQLVDEREQRRRALAQEPDLLRLVGVEVGVREERGEADDRVHGRAQLVADVPQEAGLRLVGGGELAPALVELGVQRDDAGVGLLELRRELVVHREDPAVRLLQLLVEAPQLVLLVRQLVERPHELGVLHAHLVARVGDVRGGGGPAHAREGRLVRARGRGQGLGEQHARARRVDLQAGDEPSGGRDAAVARVALDEERRPRHDLGAQRGLREPGQDAHDDVGRAGADRGPPDLGQRRRDAHLVLRVEAQQPADLAPGPAQREHVGVRAELGDEEGGAHAASRGSAAPPRRSRRGARRGRGAGRPRRREGTGRRGPHSRRATTGPSVRRCAARRRRPARRGTSSRAAAGRASRRCRGGSRDRATACRGPSRRCCRARRSAARRPTPGRPRRPRPGCRRGRRARARGARPGCREARRGRPAPRPRRPPRRAVRGRARRRRGDSARRRRGAPRGRRRTRPARSWGGSRPWGPRGRWSRRARRTSPR